MEDLYTYDSGNYSDYMGGSSFDSPLSSLDESAMTILAVMGIIALVISVLSSIPSSALTAPNTTVRSTTTDPFQTKNDSHYELLERNLLLC